jgi:hypothetical protein
MLLKITQLIFKLSSDFGIGGGSSAPPDAVFIILQIIRTKRIFRRIIIRHVTMLKTVSTLFMRHTTSLHVFVLIYVDDIIVIGSDMSSIEELITNLQREFNMKDLGNLLYFLGVHVLRDSHGLHPNQAKYILDLLDRTDMLGAKPYAAPCISGKKLTRFDGDPLSGPTSYRQVIGALQYCALTRPDIPYSVNQLCQFLQYPTTSHFTAAKMILRYLKGTADYGLYFTSGPLQLHAYCDSDWAGDPIDIRSTSGYSVFLGPSLISW